MLKESIGHTVPSISPLGTKVSGCEVVLRESIGHTLLSIISLKEKERDGQAALKAGLKESIGHL